MRAGEHRPCPLVLVFSSQPSRVWPSFHALGLTVSSREREEEEEEEGTEEEEEEVCFSGEAKGGWET